MKYGTETGSLINGLMSRQIIGAPTPEVGMGATMLSWTDRNPGTIIEVFKKGKTQYVKIQADDYRRIDNNGLSDCQDYEYNVDPEGHVRAYRVGKNGRWEACGINPETGRYVKRCGGLIIGEREKYHDFSF